MARTLAEIKRDLQPAVRAQYEVLARALAADERKGVKQALTTARRRLDAQDAEASRLQQMYEYQEHLAPGCVVAGLDEVGRGPVAGPLCVACVVLPPYPRIAGLNDSKQVPEQSRPHIAQEIKDVALAWDIQYVQPDYIDEHGMSAALRLAFSRSLAAVEAQGISVDVALLDGNPLGFDPRERNVVKGDAKCASIAAASLIAKVDRDALMCRLALDYPQYGFEKCKGYASAEHIQAIKDFGLTPVHRASFCTAWTQETLF